LRDIACNDSMWKNRKNAVLRIKDENFRAEVAFSDSNQFVRMCAFRGISDEKLLERIALNHPDEEIRDKAAHRLKRVKKHSLNY
jgi:hypothetical protein